MAWEDGAEEETGRGREQVLCELQRVLIEPNYESGSSKTCCSALIHSGVSPTAVNKATTRKQSIEWWPY